MEPIQIMEAITIGVTLLLFATGIVPCMNMYRTQSTKNVPFVIFLLSVLNCSGMVHYCMMKDLTSIMWLNVVGFLLNIAYVFTYLSVVRSKTRPVGYVSVGVLYVSVLYYYLYNVIGRQPELGDFLGQMTSYLATTIMCIPAVELINNVRYKNADGMPAVMLLGGLLCGFSWLTYGLMLNDPNIYRPNFPGIAINCAKLLVIALWGSSSSDPKAKTS